MASLFKENLGLRLFAFTKIPLLWYVGTSVVESTENKIVMRIPLNRRTKNHLNVMYFGALGMGADICIGFKAFQIIHQKKAPLNLLFKDFKIDFLRRAEGDVHFICEEGDKVRALIEKAMATGERETAPINGYAIVPSISDEKVAQFTLSLSLKKRQNR